MSTYTLNGHLGQTYPNTIRPGFLLPNIVMGLLFVIITFEIYFAMSQNARSYTSTSLNKEKEDDMSLIRKFHIVNLIIFDISLIIYIVLSFLSIFNVGNVDIIQIMELISCIISIVFCISSLVCFCIGLIKTKKSLNNKDTILSLCFQMLLIYLLNNIFYYNIKLDMTIIILISVVFTILIITMGLNIKSTLGITIATAFFISQIYSTLKMSNLYKNTKEALNADDLEVSELLSQIATLNDQLFEITDQANDLSEQLNASDILNGNLLASNKTLSDSNLSLSESNTTLNQTISANATANIRAKIVNNVNILSAQSSYLDDLVTTISYLDQQMTAYYSATNTYFEGYGQIIQGVKSQVDTLVTQGNNLITSIDNNTMNQSDLSTFTNNLTALLSNKNFVRCQVFFDGSSYTGDCMQFNLLYELTLRVFCNFFRPTHNVGWNNSNEQTARDIIIYTKKTPAAYNALSSYSRGLVDQLYALIDGDNIWTVLSGNILSDNNSQSMNNNIANNTNYNDIYLDNGVRYISLIAELGSQNDFYNYFNSGQQRIFDWQSIVELSSALKSLQQNNFGLIL